MDYDEDSVSTISILTTCRGRERPGYQMWLAGEGFEKEEKEIEKTERILVRGGIFTRSTISRDSVKLSRRVKEKQKHKTYDTEECYVAKTTVLQLKTEQMRLFEERRDRNRSESRPRRGERGRERENGRQNDRERTGNIYRKEDVN